MGVGEGEGAAADDDVEQRMQAQWSKWVKSEIRETVSAKKIGGDYIDHKEDHQKDATITANETTCPKTSNIRYLEQM